MSGRFGFIPVKPEVILRDGAFDQAVDSYIMALEKLGGERWSERTLENPKPLFYLMASGGSEGVLLKLRAERNKSVGGEPAFLLAHPAYNSLPASLEVLARIKQDKQLGRIYYLNGPDDEAGFGEIKAAVRDMEVRLALKGARIGLVGAPSDWLVASSPDPGTVQRMWGPEVVPIPLDEITQKIKTVNPMTIAPILETLVAGATDVVEPSPADLEEVVRVYVALRGAIERHNLDALTLRCFDLVLDLGTTGCFSLAQLTDEGIIAGCEADLVSTVGMLWTYKLLGQLPWMANPTQLDRGSNSLWLTHCTVPKHIVGDYRLRSHFESGLGVGIQGTFSKGPVTLLRIGGTQMEKIWLAEGEIIETGDAENLCRTQVEVRLTHGKVQELLHVPLGNHLILIKGHYKNRLQTWWETMFAQ